MEEEFTQMQKSEQDNTTSGTSDATSKWARKRQAIYIISIVVVLLILGAYPVFKLLYVAPSCFDGKQNQDEVGIDCGGSSCSVLYSTQVEDLIVSWTKAFAVNEDTYDIASSIENPNYNAGIKSISYVFKVYGEDGSLITEKHGDVFISPRDKFVVFEPNIQTGGKSIKDVVFEFQKNPVWTKMSQQAPTVVIKNKKLINTDSSPRFSASVFNNSIDSLLDAEIVAIVYNGSGNPIAVSSTYEKQIRKDETKNIFFTWPNKFTTKPSGGMCTAPTDIVLVFDRSGSMGFGGDNPPQPLTDAKKAALAFVDNTQVSDRVGLVSFSTTASNPIDQTLTKDKEEVKNSIKSIKIGIPANEQHTNIGDAISQAVKELKSVRANTSAKKAIVLLTDGVASRPLNPKDETDENYPNLYASNFAGIARDNNMSIYTIGLGNSINEDFLRENIASTPNYYYKAITSSELSSIYNQIAQDVCKEEVFTTDIIVHTKPVAH